MSLKLQRYRHQSVQRLVFAINHSGGVKHSLGGFDGVGFCVFIGVIDYFGDAGLNQGLGTFVTRKQGGINLGSPHIDAGVV